MNSNMDDLTEAFEEFNLRLTPAEIEEALLKIKMRRRIASLKRSFKRVRAL